jgi:hypothetical protein
MVAIDALSISGQLVGVHISFKNCPRESSIVNLNIPFSPLQKQTYNEDGRLKIKIKKSKLLGGTTSYLQPHFDHTWMSALHPRGELQLCVATSKAQKIPIYLVHRKMPFLFTVTVFYLNSHSSKLTTPYWSSHLSPVLIYSY